ncbi:hypothetical protein CBL_08853 [Carabus blaptoides fortunei]
MTRGPPYAPSHTWQWHTPPPLDYTTPKGCPYFPGDVNRGARSIHYHVLQGRSQPLPIYIPGVREPTPLHVIDGQAALFRITLVSRGKLTPLEPRHTSTSVQTDQFALGKFLSFISTGIGVGGARSSPMSNWCTRVREYTGGDLYEMHKSIGHKTRQSLIKESLMIEINYSQIYVEGGWPPQSRDPACVTALRGGGMPKLAGLTYACHVPRPRYYL